jgi:NitT/TauT family transport system substrate-binding protein
MVRATLRGLDYTIKNPDEAFTIVREVIPEITDEDAPVQRQVLDASIEQWQSDKLGFSSPEAWQASVDFMKETGLFEGEVEAEALYTNKFVEAQ